MENRVKRGKRCQRERQFGDLGNIYGNMEMYIDKREKEKRWIQIKREMKRENLNNKGKSFKV